MTFAGTDNLIELKHFTSSECELISDRIRSLKTKWTAWSDSPLLALGTPAYRFNGDRSSYRSIVELSNDFLLRSFSDIYRQVLRRLSSLFDEQVYFLHSIAHPGFHILQFDRNDIYSPGQPHCDTPFLKIPWLQSTVVEQTMNLSFVLPLCVPKQPCGLDTYDYYRGAPSSVVDCWQEQEHHFHPYEPGVIYVFSGDQYHRLSRAVGEAHEQRITLQGHLARINGFIAAYW